MKLRQDQHLDLFPTHIYITDFETSNEFNQRIISTAEFHPEFNDSRTDRNLLCESIPWISHLKRSFDEVLSRYLKAVHWLANQSAEIDAYMFLNYTKAGGYTPPHNHMGDADLVGIYYAKASSCGTATEDYYNLPEGVLLLHDPRNDSQLDNRGPETAGFFMIVPQPGRMIMLPASLLHSVTPAKQAGDRVSVVCNYLVNHSKRRTNYASYILDDVT